MAKRAQHSIAQQARDMVDINWLPCHSVYGQDLARPHSIPFHSALFCQRQETRIGTLALNAARKTTLINKSGAMNGNLKGLVTHTLNREYFSAIQIYTCMINRCKRSYFKK